MESAHRARSVLAGRQFRAHGESGGRDLDRAHHAVRLDLDRERRQRTVAGLEREDAPCRSRDLSSAHDLARLEQDPGLAQERIDLG